MICNICLVQCQQYVEIPCGHDICEACTLQNMKEDETIRCPTCLMMHSLRFIRRNGRKSVASSESEKARKLFCLDCCQSFEFTSLIHGRHRNHNLKPLSQYLPSLKEIALSQLNKTLTIQNTILLNTHKENDETNYQELQSLYQKIRSHFEKERQLLLAKENLFLEQMEAIKARIRIELQKKRQSFLHLYEEIHEINESIEQFLSDESLLDHIEALGVFKGPIDRYFLVRTKQIEKQVSVLPKFICLSTLQQYLNTNLLLTYPPKHQQSPPLVPTSRRVNLRAKITKKLFSFDK